MKKHRAQARWNKGLKDGEGEVKTGNGAIESKYSYASRFGDSNSGTSPEELIGAAHAGCFSMFLSALMGNQDLTPEYIETKAVVSLGEKDGAPLIQKIELTTEAKVDGLDENTFQELVQQAKAGCPVSKALNAVPEITVEASLAK
ncbi:osmotically inducible protein OsmC [Pontibacter ummariensis]|uniref:Osmotically inducible protein OsmC n=1 Tax=Pontibacter ummariensis TaxID=1610492 RepID=A0A239E7T5_9BACT|nr:OsmC family peroxiredoxin [Pontibacter ummariensis]PRY13096.1 osmotically inducible protein OsmC [Pontibacter ummariensis]SNS39982.1 osmotically inducible protein OsmC [Pontibacter ummariensis]